VTAYDTSGSNPFEAFYVKWWVPTHPSNNGALEYIWPGLENLYSNGDWASVIQPVLQWGSNGDFGGNYWSMAAWVVNNGGSAWHSTPVTVYDGDELGGSLWMVSSSEWQIQANDYTRGTYTWTQNTPGSQPSYNWAQLGVVELYDLTSCNQLSTDNQAMFQLTAAYEQGPYWNSGNDVTNSLTWSGTTDGMTPDCSWDAWESSKVAYLQWSTP
jgi:hypothetical protein